MSHTWITTAIHRGTCLVIGGFSYGVFVSPASSVWAKPAALNPQIQIGIVQQFGRKADQRLRIGAAEGHSLKIHLCSQGQPETLTATNLELSLQQQPLATPQRESRLVLSSHRSYESAADSGQQFQRQGIPVELAQPSGWEVWANRETYEPPLFQELLLQNLHQQGFPNVRRVQQIRKSLPQPVITVGDSGAASRAIASSCLEVNSSGKTIRVNGRPYPGQLRLQPNAYGTYTLINQVALEDYLRGVVPHEIGPSAPQAAVEAQAILARTYALRNRHRFGIDGYELCADVQCQVYKGWADTVASADTAIQRTHGQVLTYADQLVDAVYSSTSGGVTAAYEDVWGGEGRPYLRGRIDQPQASWDLATRPLANEANLKQFLAQTTGFNESGWDWFRWQRSSSLALLQAQLQRHLQKEYPAKAQFQTLKALRIKERSPRGRVLQMEALTDRGPVLIGRDEIRRIFTAPRSTLFYLEPQRNAQGTLIGYRFVGGGFGHGVGLSQTGAYRLADLGWVPERILEFYYPGSQIQPLTAEILAQSS
jgi:SpoIID/LytB domain protein